MWDYLDNINKSRRKRARIYVDNEFAPEEEKAPKNAPFWTKTGYNRSLKKFVDCYVRPAVTDMENIDEVVEDNYGNDNNNQEKSDEPKKSDDELDKSDNEKRNKSSVVSEEYNSSSESK